MTLTGPYLALISASSLFNFIYFSNLPLSDLSSHLSMLVRCCVALYFIAVINSEIESNSVKFEGI